MPGSIYAKVARLKNKDHTFLFLFALGVLWLHWGGWWLVPDATAVIPPFAVAYALFYAGTKYRRVKGRVHQDALAEMKKQYSSTGAILEQKPEIRAVPKRPIDLKRYIETATNSNLFITGRSGSGKSTLMCYTIDLFKDSNKIVFSFKANDEYLKLGIPILRIADFAGNPFADKEAFVQAFLVTYPMSSQGIIAASVPNLLRSLLKMCDSWEDFKEATSGALAATKADGITHSAYLFIEQKIPDLELETSHWGMEGIGSIVFDFSGLNEAAKSFYAELYLRQMWRAIELGEEHLMKNIIIIDEAHRLLKSEATVFGEVARLIRSRGALWCGTQNYSDLPDYVRNQFAIQLLFSTNGEKDLRALKEINALLPFVATEIKDHHFTDAAARTLHDEIPIYTTDIPKREKSEENFVKPAKPGDGDRPDEKKEGKPTKDYVTNILNMLTEEAAWPTKLARAIAKNDGIDLEKAKFAVSKALRKLQKDGLVGREHMKIGDKEVVLYYRRDSSMSGLHKYMVNELVKRLNEKGIPYTLPSGREGEPDISTEKYDIEVETGLKNDLRTFAQRIANRSKETYIVVPNEVEEERYRKIDNAKVVTLAQWDAE